MENSQGACESRLPLFQAVPSMTFEILHGALVLFGRGAGLERAEVAALAGLRIGLARIEAIFARGQLADHGVLLT